jgi:hypothetical protein
MCLAKEDRPAIIISHLKQGAKKQASGCQPRRAVFWKAQHIDRYVSICNSRTTLDHGARRSFSTPC